MMNSKIMVVDDDEKILFAFQQVLEKEGYKCLKVKTGADAIKTFDNERPRLIFLDIILPDSNGLEVLHQIKHIDHSVPVIIISGQKTIQNITQADKLGALEFLSKPLSVTEVRRALAEALPSRKALSAQDANKEAPAFSESKEQVLNEFEKQFISRQLMRHNGNITAAARASKMSRQHFYRLLVKHHIKPDRLQ